MNIAPSLLAACIREERRAQFELYKKCYAVLMSVCLRYERNKEDAEFMLNAVFYKILQNLKTYDPSVPFEAWIRRIAINAQIDEFRRKARQKLDFVESPMDLAPIEMMDINDAEKDFDEDALLQMIQNLPPVSQKVFNLFVIDGFNHKEIGEQLEISEGTSKWHLSNARKKLRKMLRRLMNKVAVLL